MKRGLYPSPGFSETDTAAACANAVAVPETKLSKRAWGSKWVSWSRTPAPCSGGAPLDTDRRHSRSSPEASLSASFIWRSRSCSIFERTSSVGARRISLFSSRASAFRLEM